MKFHDSNNCPEYNGNTYYENMCIKTLNQTIGRGIRHIDDYANIFLIDNRFLKMKDKLSDWMKPWIRVIPNL
jgi:chromosome transmission fidelity protein 1